MNRRLKHSKPPLPTQTALMPTIKFIGLHSIRVLVMRAFHTVFLDAADKRDGRSRLDGLGIWLAFSCGFRLSLLEIAPKDEEFFAQLCEGVIITAETGSVSVV